jgi:alkylation response protein AidB-like acyl-CoA dehydrogenase
MDFNDTPQEAAFRAEVRSWLEANAKPKSATGFSAENPRFQRNEQEALKVAKAWQAKKADKRYARITWPKENGGLGGTPTTIRKSRSSMCRRDSSKSASACAFPPSRIMRRRKLLRGM